MIGILDKTPSEKELMSAIKQAKGTNTSLFTYEIITENNRRGVEVSFNSDIIDVTGFPLKAFTDDNVNWIVEQYIKAN